MPAPAVALTLDGPVARITLNRPEVLNAGDPRWVAELNAVVAAVAARTDLRVAVIGGAGRAFCTGVDLKALAAGAMTLPQFVAWEDAMTAIERLPLPFIAAINGHCLGGGLQLALVCDYRLAAAEAVIGLPAVKECLIPSMALYRLPRMIGAARARELILTGEPIRRRARGNTASWTAWSPARTSRRRSRRAWSASWPCPPPACGGASA
jgi:enoyl-CoA hydratase/carnithine racemase